MGSPGTRVRARWQGGGEEGPQEGRGLQVHLGVRPHLVRLRVRGHKPCRPPHPKCLWCRGGERRPGQGASAGPGEEQVDQAGRTRPSRRDPHLHTGEAREGGQGAGTGEGQTQVVGSQAPGFRRQWVGLAAVLPSEEVIWSSRVPPARPVRADPAAPSSGPNSLLPWASARMESLQLRLWNKGLGL